jgi:hypothetical protein
MSGQSILGWRSGAWGFILTTTSDQGPNDFHVVDLLADQIAEYADQQPAIRYSQPTPNGHKD